uniref:Uncharacterized protein AlNc14C17G1806 n=1 Tax=Albugo laibachii Nc14 TaxID=890382 RepID=F0W4I5_9STRA|nr:conserved hypothetical protein [Albugo laibachii Nc14]|eukprot:CCA16018.1 conserved hypothetical protein [Albugo laibachii Nc14]
MQTNAETSFQRIAFAETDCEQIDGSRMRALMEPLMPFENLKKPIVEISLRNKSLTLAAARQFATYVDIMNKKNLLGQLKVVDFHNVTAGQPKESVADILKFLSDPFQFTTSVESIDLSQNALVEKETIACVGLLENKRNLKHLYLCNCELSGEVARSIVYLVVPVPRGTTRLETLHLDNISNDDSKRAIVKILGSSSFLCDFRFSATHAPLDGIFIAIGLKGCPTTSLTKLDLSGATIGAHGAVIIAEALRRQAQMKYLNLRNCGIKDAGMRAIAGAIDAIFKSKNRVLLERIDLSVNELRSDSMVQLVQLLPVMKHLEILELERNNFGSSGTLVLADALRNAHVTPAIATLNMSCSGIGKEGALALANACVFKQHLESLALEGNNLSEAEITTIVASLKESRRIGTTDKLISNVKEEDQVEGLAALMEKISLSKKSTLFEFMEKSREVVDAGRVKQLLISNGVSIEDTSKPLNYDKIVLRGKSYTADAAKALAELFLSRLVNLKAADLADIIAGRPEDEALCVLQIVCDALSGHQLEEIDLSDNALGEKGVRACLSLLKPQSRLRHLYFCNNGISASAASFIAQEVVLQIDAKDNLAKTACTLETFHFYNNMSGPDGCIAVADMLEHCCFLTSFRYASARAGLEASEKLARSIAIHMKHLRYLDLSDCSFQHDGASALADAIGRQKQLEFLKLRDASLGQDGLVQILKAINGAKINLKHLDISGNELGDKGLVAIAPMIAKQAHLEMLVLEENEITSDGLAEFSEWLAVNEAQCNDSLMDLSFYGNEIDSEGTKALTEWLIPQLHQLSRLNLNSNAISHSGVAKLQEDLKKLGKAETLGSLEENDFDDGI